MIRNVIFDWSGTLVDDLEAVLEATNHVFVQSGAAPFTRETFRSEFSLPFTGFYKRFLPHVPMPELERWFHERFSQVQELVRPIAHAREFLEFCERQGFRTFVLSTVRTDYFQQQARAVGFDRYLQVPYLGVWDKREKIRELIQDHSLSVAETVFVGDMEHDVDTAKFGGVSSCAVLTGYNRLEQLRAVEPDWIVEHLGEFQALLSRAIAGEQAEISGASPRRPIVTVGALIQDPIGRVLMIRTRKWSDLWGIPGGKIEWGESSETALRREILEETGLRIQDIRFVMVQDSLFSREFYREAHFVLLNYICRVDAAQSMEVQLNAEAQEYRWMDWERVWDLPLNQPTQALLRTVAEQRTHSRSS